MPSCVWGDRSLGRARCQRDVHLRRRAPALAGVRLVDDDGELPAPVLVSDLVQDERELLNRRDDDLFAFAQEAPQIAASHGVADRRRHLGELFDGIPLLFVPHPAVGHHDDRNECRGRPQCLPIARANTEC